MLATDAHREGRKKEDERGIYPSVLANSDTSGKSF